jgi:hypothetical protein
MKFYFMPYDPNLGSIMFAKHEYSQLGNNGQGMKKNAQNLMDDAEAGIQSTVVWFNGVTDGLKYCKKRGDSVLIRGHGMPGLESIEGGRGGERVDCETIVDRLKKSGLPKSFSGTISCFSCHSGESGGTDMGGNGQPFAATMKKELKKRGYKSCTVVGYLGAIDSFAKSGSAGKQIYARQGGTGGASPELGTLTQATVTFH